jgi:GGDEF domain-containing protein
VPQQTAKPENGQRLRLEETLKKCFVRKGDILFKRERDNIWAAVCEAGLEGARVIRERIKGEIQKHFMEAGDPSPVVKVGVATYPEEAITKRELFRRAKTQLRG